MAGMGNHEARDVQHSAGKGGALRRAWVSAWFVTLVMGATTMAFQVFHSVHYGGMPWPLAWLYGTVPLVIAMAVLEIVAEWKAAPWPAKVTAYAIMAGAMFLSASATGAVVLHAAPPHYSLLFGALLDAAELFAAYFIMNGPRAADAAADAAAKAREEAQRQAAFASAVAAEREARSAAETERDTAQRQAQEAAQAAASSAKRASAAAELQARVSALEEVRDTADAARAEAEKRAEAAEAKAERLTRKLGPNSGANRTRNAAAKDTAKNRTTVPNDVDARAQALMILTEEPNITGKDLGERCGRGERWGQLRKSELAGHVAGNGDGSVPGSGDA